MLKLQCSQCLQTFEVPDSLVGQLEKCPNCGQGNIVVDATPVRGITRPLGRPAKREASRDEPSWTEAGLGLAGILFVSLSVIGIILGAMALAGRQLESPLLFFSGSAALLLTGALFSAVAHILQYLRRIAAGIEID